MRDIGRVEYKGGKAIVYDIRGLIVTHMPCDSLIGYGPVGFVIKRGSSYWVCNPTGNLAMPPLVPYKFEKEKWNMHDTYLRIMC